MGQQQEFFSDQGQASESFRSRRRGEKLKEEHPATFEDSTSSYSYQDRVTYKGESGEKSAHTAAFAEAGRRQRSVPWWAKPQTQKSKKKNIVRWIVVIAVAIVVIKLVIPLLLGLILALIAAAAFLILIPLIIIFVLLIALAVVAALAVLGFAGRLRVHHRR